MLNTRVEKNVTPKFEELWAEWSRTKCIYIYIFWTVVLVFELKQRCFMEFWKIIPVFAQEKEF